jgi:hypothetical protein
MKLKEKFLPFVDWINSRDDNADTKWPIRNATECEKIADDYAIKFAEWIAELEGGNLNLKVLKHLLEMFKKEKGL